MSSRYNVIWSTPSPDASGSMPLGNGSTALNVWVESDGKLYAYIARGDCWGEFGQLYKLGKFSVFLHSGDGSPVLTGTGFRWELRLEEGLIRVSTNQAQLDIRVDAHHPAVYVTAEGPADMQAVVESHVWRKERKRLQGQESHSLHSQAPYEVFHEPDVIPDLPDHRIGFYHRNHHATWQANLEQQGLADLADPAEDPLLHRSFGALLFGPGLQKASLTRLVSRQASSAFTCTVCVDSGVEPDVDRWVRGLTEKAASLPEAGDRDTLAAHASWWKSFWERSWMHADGNGAARKISRGYALQRFMNACAGRGEFPIKFNGSLFTVDWNIDGEGFDADYRRWGPGYWHQNTRLPYWAMPMAGDLDLMKPYFEMYRRNLPLARERCRRFCGHEGAFFLETQTFWGTYLEHNYGWTEFGGADPLGNYLREPDLPGHLCQNQYIRRHNSSGLEVVYHGLLTWRYSQDDDFLRSTVLPLAEAVLEYYDLHYPRKNGKLHLSPAQVIEQWWEAENPLPEIAGLTTCLTGLLALPDALCTRRKDWTRLLRELPAVPTGIKNGKRVFTPAERWKPEPRNQENPELYAVFPYHLCSKQTEDADIGIETFHNRDYTHDRGWAQDGMQAALLGLTDATRYSVTERLTVPSPYARFPVFWGPGFDWVPDQDQGGSASHAFQLMALQERDGEPDLLPAWPEEWSLEAKLHLPGRNTVEIQHTPGA